MPLTELAIRKSKPADKPVKLSDEKGLFLLLTPSGGKWWRIKYRIAGREKLLSLGTYPEITLKDARERRDEIRKQLANGIDPSEHRKAKREASAERGENSLEVIARKWWQQQSSVWNHSHAHRILRRLERDIFPWLGQRPVADITPPELLSVIRRIETRGAIETAHRALQNCGQIYRYAVATGRSERDITADLKGALPPAQATHFAAVTEPAKVAEFLRMIDTYQGTFTVQCALKLAPLVFVRPGELRQAEWKDIDLEAAEWRYLVTKTKTQHIVPLATQALVILSELYPLTGQGRYVFPSARVRNGSRPMSDVALLAALRRMGIDKEEASIHGFRALARTILDEVLGFRPDFIEHQLAHAVRDPNGRAYNRTAHLNERRKMMQTWADYLDSLKSGSTQEILEDHK